MNLKSIYNKIEFYNFSVILVSTFPLLGLKKTVFAIAIFVFFSIYIFIAERIYRNLNRQDLKNILVLSSYYIALLIFYFLSSDKSISLKLLEQNASFIIFPILLLINKSVVSKSTLNRSLNVFVISNVIVAIYVWSNIYSYGIVKSFEENTYYNPVLRFFFSRLSGMHLPYLGMLFVFSCLVLLNQLLYKEKEPLLKKIFKAGVLLFLLISVFTFAARQSLIIFFIISFFIIILKTKTVQKKTLILASTILISIPLFYLPSVKIRIDEIKQTKLILPTKGQNSDEVNFRYGIYDCTFKLIKQNWLTGVGPENVQKRLDECYSSYTYKSFDDFQHKSYNTHNQFFDILLKFGIFGILGFILYIFWGIKNNLEYYYIFISLCILSMLTENILNRQVGIVFFNFFNSLFFVEYLNRKRDMKVNLD